MRTQKLADKSPDRLADRGHLEVELTSLGRLEIVGFACPEIVGFDLSTEVVPDAHADLILRLEAPGRPTRFELNGLPTRPFVNAENGPRYIVGVRFRPGRAFPC